MTTLKILGVGFLILLVATGAFWRSRYRTSKTTHVARKVAPEDGMSVYLGLRNLALQRSRAQLGLPATSAPTEPWAVLMDMGMSPGTATVIAVSDGTASIYLSSGGGYIGGAPQHEAIRKAALNMLDLARQYQPLMRPTQDFPLPQEGQIVFYAVADAGIFTASAPERDLAQAHDWLHSLYAAGQEIITQYRLISPN